MRRNISLGWRAVSFLLSAVVLVAAIIDYGFVLDDVENSVIHGIYDFAWWVYLVAFPLQLFVSWSAMTRKNLFLTILSGTLLLLSLLPHLFSMPLKLLNGAWGLFGGGMFRLLVVLGFSLLEMSRGIVGLINKKTNPAMLMAVCFAVVIAVGTILLLFPRSTLDGVRLQVVDALFVSTSAVCVTGLSTVDVAGTFSLEGLTIIAVLIQIGGLGVMTVTSFFAIFFMGGVGFYNQLAIKDMIGSDTFGSLISTLLYILGFTFVIEIAGAFFIWLSIHSTLGMTLHEEIFFSMFHSVSAFCNAGFSTLSGNLGNERLLTGHNMFYIIISLLIILGGIGFPILLNFKKIFVWHCRMLLLRLFKGKREHARYVHLANINTKIVLYVTAVLLFLGTLLIAILEWNGAFVHMPPMTKIVQAFFNAVAPRTAGFNSVSLTQFSFLTILLYMLLMWIGGASQSSAGGVKVNTVAVAFANLFSVAKGRDTVILFNREVSEVSLRRANATIFASIILILLFFTVLVTMEPQLPPKALLFETVSAYCTVGSSLDVTPQLGNGSRILVTVLMFIGRVSFITILTSFVQQTDTPKYRLPKDNVIIN